MRHRSAARPSRQSLRFTAFLFAWCHAAFDDAKGIALVGIITRVNRRTATLQAMDGRNWRSASNCCATSSTYRSRG